MRPIRHQDWRADTAAKLEQIELVAALLERDATNNRHFVRDFAPAWSRLPGKRKRIWFPRTRKFLNRVQFYGAAIHAGISAVIHSRLVRASIRHSWLFAVDLVVILAIIASGCAAFTLGVLMLATPV